MCWFIAARLPAQVGARPIPSVTLNLIGRRQCTSPGTGGGMRLAEGKLRVLVVRKRPFAMKIGHVRNAQKRRLAVKASPVAMGHNRTREAGNYGIPEGAFSFHLDSQLSDDRPSFVGGCERTEYLR